MGKFYEYLSDEQKELLSLNFLLSKKLFADGHYSNLDIKGTEIKAQSTLHSNKEFFCMIFYKHISRYIEDIKDYSIKQL